MRCTEWLLEEAAVVMDMPLNVFLLINIRIKKIYPIWYSFFSHNNTVYLTYNEIVGAVVVVIVLLLDLQLPVQSVPITTKVVSSNPAHGEVYSIQPYVIKFISDFRQVGGFLHQ